MAGYRFDRFAGCGEQLLVPGVPKPGLATAILHEYGLDLSNREIAMRVGCHHNTVARYLKLAGLEPNIRHGVPPERVDETHSRCWKCGDIQPDDQFPFVRNRVDGRRLSFCRQCRKVQSREAIAASPQAYFFDREARMRRGEHGARRSRSDIVYSLPDGYLIALWHWQRAKCFYTDRPMVIVLGKGLQPQSPSVDRVDPTCGYMVGNVVLCLNRVNSIKQNVTLAEMAEWMPGWHERIVTRLPLVVAEVSPIVDNTPRAANGRRLPSWIVDRRRRIEALSGLLAEASQTSFAQTDHSAAGREK
jgi:hypothetical protein